jgi:hypothetical protein
MDGHPPLCPKTEEVFRDGWHQSVLVDLDSDQMLTSGIEMHRRFIARYQSCAWKDRADRWWNVWYRVNSTGHVDRNFEWHRLANEADNNAEAWREWELSHAID